VAKSTFKPKIYEVTIEVEEVSIEGKPNVVPKRVKAQSSYLKSI